MEYVYSWDILLLLNAAPIHSGSSRPLSIFGFPAPWRHTRKTKLSLWIQCNMRWKTDIQMTTLWVKYSFKTRMWLILDLWQSTRQCALYNLAFVLDGYSHIKLVSFAAVKHFDSKCLLAGFLQASPAANLKSLILSYSNYQHYVNYPPHYREFKSCI